jgi:hypothetical protein
MKKLLILLMLAGIFSCKKKETMQPASNSPAAPFPPLAVSCPTNINLGYLAVYDLNDFSMRNEVSAELWRNGQAYDFGGTIRFNTDVLEYHTGSYYASLVSPASSYLWKVNKSDTETCVSVDAATLLPAITVSLPDSISRSAGFTFTVIVSNFKNGFLAFNNDIGGQPIMAGVIFNITNGVNILQFTPPASSYWPTIPACKFTLTASNDSTLNFNGSNVFAACTNAFLKKIYFKP